MGSYQTNETCVLLGDHQHNERLQGYGVYSPEQQPSEGRGDNHEEEDLLMSNIPKYKRHRQIASKKKLRRNNLSAKTTRIYTRTSGLGSLEDPPPWGLFVIALLWAVLIRILIVYFHNTLLESGPFIGSGPL